MPDVAQHFREHRSFHLRFYRSENYVILLVEVQGVSPPGRPPRLETRHEVHQNKEGTVVRVRCIASDVIEAEFVSALDAKHTSPKHARLGADPQDGTDVVSLDSVILVERGHDALIATGSLCS